MGIRKGVILPKRKVWVKSAFLLIFVRPVVTVLSSCGGLLKTGIISGSWLSEPWTAEVVTGRGSLVVVSSLGSLAGIGGCFVRKGERKTEIKMICCLFCCSGRLVSPKWKNFKGLKLQWRDKIRLNNAIWRAWYMQCEYRAGGGSLGPRWQRIEMTAWWKCAQGLMFEAVLWDQGFPGCAERCKHSPTSPCSVLFIRQQSRLAPWHTLALKCQLSAGPAPAQLWRFCCCFRPGEAQEPRVPLCDPSGRLRGCRWAPAARGVWNPGSSPVSSAFLTGFSGLLETRAA